MILKIKKYNFQPSCYGGKLILLVIGWNILSAILIGFMHFPKSIIYLGDLLNIWLFINAIHKQIRCSNFSINPPFSFMILFTLIGIIGSIANQNSGLLLLWGIRQNVRYFIFFYSCTVFMQDKDLKILLKVIGIIFWISIPLCTYEALFVTYSATTIVGDMVGGIYYGMSGVNAPLNIILCVYTVYVILRYFDSKCKIGFMILTVASALYMSSLAELKAFLIEIIIILLFAMIRNGIRFKTIFLGIVGIIAFSVFLNYFVLVNSRGRSYYNMNFLSIEGMIEYATKDSGYDGVGDLNRFSAVFTLVKKFFSNDIIGMLFGLGLGGAEYSFAFSALTSSFYQNYSYMHYQFFSTAFIFIETGLLGLFSYIMIFLSSFISSIKRLKGSYWSDFYLISIILMLIVMIYNTSLRNEQCAYILYAILSIPFSRVLQSTTFKY